MSDARDKDAALVLDGGYRVHAKERSGQLTISAPDGRICLNVRVTPEGLSVSLDSAALAVHTAGAVSLSCGELEVAAERDIRLRAGGAIVTEAEEQHHRASLGDVTIDANDDVVLDGERVRLNSPDATRRPPPAAAPAGAAASLPATAAQGELPQS